MAGPLPFIGQNHIQSRYETIAKLACFKSLLFETYKMASESITFVDYIYEADNREQHVGARTPKKANRQQILKQRHSGRQISCLWRAPPTDELRGA